MASDFTRRGFLTRSAVLGCSAAASPLLTPVSLAATPGENRLVVILLRGGMDGLDALRPWGDVDFAAARPALSAAEGPRLSDFHGLHPALSPLMPLWAAEELAFVQATSTPYRDKRSHFDGQDLLEAGTAALLPEGRRDGWLNRALAHLPGAHLRTAFALGREDLLLLRGDAPVSNWSPEVDLQLSPQGLRLLELTMRSDPAMAAAMAEAIALASADGDSVEMTLSQEEVMQDMAETMQAANRGKAHLRLAEFAASQLREESRIASFSIGGWDTHARQDRALKYPLTRLSETILALREGLGVRTWARTTVLCMTEFGRTVRENGSRGTDHGTGGTMILAGGALRGGRVLGQWPGLSEAALYNRRDLMPTSDVRAWAAWALHQGFGLPRSTLGTEIFAGLDMGADPGLLA